MFKRMWKGLEGFERFLGVSRSVKEGLGESGRFLVSP